MRSRLFSGMHDLGSNDFQFDLPTYESTTHNKTNRDNHVGGIVNYVECYFGGAFLYASPTAFLCQHNKDYYHSMHFLPPFHWPRAHHVACK